MQYEINDHQQNWHHWFNHIKQLTHETILVCFSAMLSVEETQPKVRKLKYLVFCVKFIRTRLPVNFDWTLPQARNLFTSRVGLILVVKSMFTFAKKKKKIWAFRYFSFLSDILSPFMTKSSLIYWWSRYLFQSNFLLTHPILMVHLN